MFNLKFKKAEWMYSRYLRLALILFISLTIILEIGSLIRQTFLQSPENISDLRHVNASKLSLLIDTKGARFAYDSLKKTYANKDVGLGHAATHIFGEVLYKKIGANGLSICDESFAYACFHGLFIAAIGQHGEQAAYQLNNYCQKNMPNNFECPHGLGHGLVEYNGHSQLKKSLIMCDSLPSSSSKFGCAMGVFMEYNFPAQIVKDGGRQLSTRKLTEENINSLCQDVPPSSIWACYLSLPQWWMRTFFDYKKVGQMCSELTEEQARKQCFIGIGVQVNYKDAKNDIPKIISYCGQLPSIDAVDRCILGASWDTRSKDPQYKTKLCNLISPANKWLCQYRVSNFVDAQAP